MKFVEPVRREISALDHDLPASNIRTLTEIVSERSYMRRMTITLLGSFALIAIFLATIGIYGVLAYSVSQRSHEFGIRIAMGATNGHILRMILMKGLILAGIGSALGLIGSLFTSRFLSSMLFHVSAVDPATYIAVSLVLGLVALLACYLPARRAAKTNPMSSLRAE